MFLTHLSYLPPLSNHLRGIDHKHQPTEETFYVSTEQGGARYLNCFLAAELERRVSADVRDFVSHPVLEVPLRYPESGAPQSAAVQTESSQTRDVAVQSGEGTGRRD